MQNKMLRMIERLEPGKIFSAKDFLGIASRTTTDVALAKAADRGEDSPYPARYLRHAKHRQSSDGTPAGDTVVLDVAKWL
jgi:hypothetical protein